VSDGPLAARLGPGDLTPEGLAELCAAAFPAERLSADDLATCCFGPGGEVLGDASGAIAWVRKDFDGVAVAWILLLAVRPDRRRRGLARDLVDTVVERCRDTGVHEIHTGNCAPRYVWPGVDLSLTEALACFQDLGFEPYDHGLNMLLPTAYRAALPTGISVERETGDGALELARREFPQWEDEVARGIAKGTTFAARDPAGRTIAFGAHSVNRATWIGPMATDPNRRHGGTGHAVLAALAADIGSSFGVTAAEIGWVAPVPFYAKAGAVAHRAFRIHRLRLEPGTRAL
jgi:GNAT superfamily N-acetyltransferase